MNGGNAIVGSEVPPEWPMLEDTERPRVGEPDSLNTTTSVATPPVEDPNGYNKAAETAGQDTMGGTGLISGKVDDRAITGNLPAANNSLYDTLNEDMVNGVSREDTLRLARLADALNARSWGYVKGPRVNLDAGMSENPGWQQLDFKDVDTAEKREQGRAEQMSALKSQYTLGRQDKERQFPYITQQLWMQLEAQLGYDAASLVPQTYLQVLNTTLSERFRQFSDKQTIHQAQDIVNVLANEHNDFLSGLLIQQLVPGSALLSDAVRAANYEYQKIDIAERDARRRGDPEAAAYYAAQKQGYQRALTGLEARSVVDTATQVLSTAGQSFKDSKKVANGKK